MDSFWIFLVASFHHVQILVPESPSSRNGSSQEIPIQPDLSNVAPAKLHELLQGQSGTPVFDRKAEMAVNKDKRYN